jgi:hypothetical protein
MAEQVARGLGGQLSQPTLLWPSTGGLRRQRGAVEGGVSFWRSRKVSGRRRWAWRHQRRKGGGARSRETQGRGGEMVWSLCRLGPGRTRRGRERTRGLSGPTHFEPKSETGMGAHGRLQTTLSVWVTPLDRVFCPRRRVRTQGGHLRRPTGDALAARKVVKL